MADIADKQGNKDIAHSYRRLMRQTKWNAPLTQHELQQWENFSLIQMVVMATQNVEVREQLEAEIAKYPSDTKVLSAIRLFLNGERDEDILCDGLDYYNSTIMMAIINGVAE
ncbi:MAG: hypothetical protein AAGF26_08865 [Cyanobacteria bacterium P01_G01_bin.49]